MNNLDKLINCFSSALNVKKENVTMELAYQGISEWDSISHMILISQIEEDFGVSIDTEDVIDMSSVAKAKEILTKLGINF